MRRLILAVLLFVGTSLFPATAEAGSILFKEKGPGEEGIDLSASALFTIDGSQLTVRLRNTGDSSGLGKDVPGNYLTGVFFGLASGLALTPVSATVASGAILQAGNCNPGANCATATNVGGEFAYNTSSTNWGGEHSGNHGIAGSGYIDISKANFNGPNLEGTENPNGPNFGIVSKITTDNAFNPNVSVPLIEKEVVFVMNITKNGNPVTDLEITDISNVSFQYGTGFGQPKLPPGMKPPPGVPEPTALLLLAPAVAWAARRRTKSKAAR